MNKTSALQDKYHSLERYIFRLYKTIIVNPLPKNQSAETALAYLKCILFDKDLIDLNLYYKIILLDCIYEDHNIIMKSYKYLCSSQIDLYQEKSIKIYSDFIQPKLNNIFLL